MWMNTNVFKNGPALLIETGVAMLTQEGIRVAVCRPGHDVNWAHIHLNPKDGKWDLQDIHFNDSTVVVPGRGLNAEQSLECERILEQLVNGKE